MISGLGCKQNHSDPRPWCRGRGKFYNSSVPLAPSLDVEAKCMRTPLAGTMKDLLGNFPLLSPTTGHLNSNELFLQHNVTFVSTAVWEQLLHLIFTIPSAPKYHHLRNVHHWQFVETCQKHVTESEIVTTSLCWSLICHQSIATKWRGNSMSSCVIAHKAQAITLYWGSS